ncbi:hypothetical protein ABI59_19650 [Acidobacteria bacterium Mor1]|nr:hypothetical protein ABI59_19650 [Acidobacteria bacterium Mor1]
MKSLNQDDNVKLRSMRRLESLLGRSRKDIKRIAENSGRYYRPFPKRQGDKVRTIDNPTGELKQIQKRIQERILTDFELPESMLGGVKGRSIKLNAKLHCGAPTVVHLDLVKCFPRISNKVVYKAFVEHLGCTPRIAGLLTQLTTYRRRLPQGSPASTMLANICLLRMHNELRDVAQTNGSMLSFFVDDIGLSGNRPEVLIEQMIGIVRNHGHSVSHRKRKIMRSHEPQTLTGLSLNRRPLVPRTRRAQVRKQIYHWASQGNCTDELQRIRGAVNFVRWVSEHQGEALERTLSRAQSSTSAESDRSRQGC